MKDTLRLIVVLLVICVVAGAMLGVVNSATREPIRRAVEAERIEAMRQVLPKSDNDPMADVATVSHDGKSWAFHRARRAGKVVGAAAEATSAKGYGGDIVVMVGLDVKGTLNAVRILQQKETPGLGANIEGAKFLGQFAGLPLKGTQWAVKKDGGPIDQITAATISSRAVVEAVESAVSAYLANRDSIVDGAKE